MDENAVDRVEAGTTSRHLIRAADRATLATICADAPDEPYASLVLVACDPGGAPILLISGLADHTRNILANDRVSLLFDGTAGLEDPLTGARVSVQGRAGRTDRPEDARRYIARHPSAEAYAGFGDFDFYRVTIERAHLVAGFGRIRWVDGADVHFDMSGYELLEEAEAEIVRHMNEDHGDAVSLYAEFVARRRRGDWRMTGIDPEGCDLRLAGETARIDFEKTVIDAQSARRELVRLTKLAREYRGDELRR